METEQKNKNRKMRKSSYMREPITLKIGQKFVKIAIHPLLLLDTDLQHCISVWRPHFSKPISMAAHRPINYDIFVVSFFLWAIAGVARVVVFCGPR